MRDRVFIIGGGPSVEQSSLKKLTNEETIAVNKSAFFVPNATHFITMDYTVLSKVGVPRVKNLSCAKHFVINMSIDYIQSRGGVPTDVRSNRRYDQLFDVFDTIHICHREDGLGVNFNDFRCGNNSGYCALQLAFLLGFRNIYLLGFDMNTRGTRTHFHSGYREQASIFAKRVAGYINAFNNCFQEARVKYPDVKVYSCSESSGLNNIIPYVNFNKVVK